MSSFSIKSISQLNLSLNIDNKKNIENIQIIINDLKELIDILSFRISEVSVSTQQQISTEITQLDQQVDEQFDSFIYDSTVPDSSVGGGTSVTGDTSVTEDNTNAVVMFI